MDLSFSGAGFMGCYYFGVVNCWNKYIPRDRVRRVAGASAGSLIAAYYLMDLPLDESLGIIISMTEDIRRRPLGVFDRSNQVVDVLPRALDRMFPPDAHKRVSGRLFVCMTRLKDMKCVIVNEFETRQDLIDALNCSCFIPVWSGNHVSTYKGTKYIDGGFTNNLPVFDEHTIRICCFSGASDIAPYDRAQTDLSASLMGMPINLTWKNMRRAGRALWPPPPSYIIELLERGFHDTKSFILSNDLIQCNRCFKATEIEFQPIYSKITPTISPAASPSVSRANSYMNLADLQRSASFRRSKQRYKSSDHIEDDDNNNKTNSRNNLKSPVDPMTLATIKQLEAMLSSTSCSRELPSLFETNRSKSGRLIKLESLESAHQAKERKSFAHKLRERFRRVSRSLSSSSEEQVNSKAESPQPPIEMPTIVVDAATEEVANEQEEDREEEQLGSANEDKHQAATIEEIMRQDSGHHEDDEADEHEEQKGSSSNESSSDADSHEGDESSDSAVGDLRTKSSGIAATTGAPSSAYMAGRRASQSPAEKYFSSRKMSLAASQTELQQQVEQQQQKRLNSLLPDRFAFAPSQLPSCPPSPNLNRHCDECIAMRQQARLDEIDASIKSVAQKYGSLVSREPEKEFSSLRYKLAGWFRQLAGGSRYSYELTCSDEEELDDDDDETLAHRRANASRQRARRPSEIPTFN